MIGCDESEKLDVEPAKYFVRVIKRENSMGSPRGPRTLAISERLTVVKLSSFSRLLLSSSNPPDAIVQVLIYVYTSSDFTPAYVGRVWRFFTVTPADATPAVCSVVDYDHMEVVQVVQDRNNTIQLIAGKPAVARVFLKLLDRPKPPVSGISDAMPVAAAVELIQATPLEQRSHFAKQIWTLRRNHGTDRRVLRPLRSRSFFLQTAGYS